MTDAQYPTLLEIRNLKKWFPIKGGLLSTVKSYVRAVDGVSLEVRKGETLGVVGESGCGKTTLGRLLLGLIPITDGEIIYDGTTISEIERQEIRKKRKERMQTADLAARVGAAGGAWP